MTGNITKVTLPPQYSKSGINSIRTFSDMSDAFDYCRGVDHPVIVDVTGEKWHLFPSGYAEKLADVRSTSLRRARGEL